MNQNFLVLKRLRQRKGEGLTPLDALYGLGCFRLASRIYDLRFEGYKITRDLEKGYATYYLDAKHWFER